MRRRAAVPIIPIALAPRSLGCARLDTTADATRRFVALVRGPEAELRLDEAALWLAAHARPDLDVADELHRLGELAARCRVPTVDALCGLLFDDESFAGNHADFADPRNSYLDQVLDRRVGIPISLAVLMMEVGRRAGVNLQGVGMPGHFLVREASDPVTLIDPFREGRRISHDDCAALFRSLFGPGRAFSPSMLRPVGPRAIIARMLANLERIHATRNDSKSLAWVGRLRAAVPGVPPAELAQLSRALTDLGRFAEAADVLERLADAGDGDGDRARDRAAALRARLN